MDMLDPITIGNVRLANRILRSATFEGMADSQGNPTPHYIEHYGKLAQNGMGAIITGFAFISIDGKAMQPGQAGIDSDTAIPAYRKVTDAAHQAGMPIFLQMAHAGRQTVPQATGNLIYGATSRRSPYFRSHPQALDKPGIKRIINGFGQAALRGKKAGFDGVQIHAAHGYLIHQFLSPAINRRNDEYGISSKTGIGGLFLEQTITAVRNACGDSFPVLIKLSGGDDWKPATGQTSFMNIIELLDRMGAAAIEVSYGTMDNALNIFRAYSIPWKVILDYNPQYRKKNPLLRYIWKSFAQMVLKPRIKPFTPSYNLPMARLAKARTQIPIIAVGGFRSGTDMGKAIEQQEVDCVSLCRPFIREPDFALRLKHDPNAVSTCINCSVCAIMCDSGKPTRCYAAKGEVYHGH